MYIFIVFPEHTDNKITSFHFRFPSPFFFFFHFKDLSVSKLKHTSLSEMQMGILFPAAFALLSKIALDVTVKTTT